MVGIALHFKLNPNVWVEERTVDTSYNPATILAILSLVIQILHRVLTGYLLLAKSPAVVNQLLSI